MSEANAAERQMLELINQERAAANLDPLVLDTRLNASSETHSEWMLEEDVFSHTGEGGSSAGDRMEDAGFDFEGSWTWGENIAWQSERGEEGISDDVEQLHDALMDSPGHRENILNPNFETIGIGIEVEDFDGYDAVMVTQNFAATDAPLEIDPGTGAGDDFVFDETEEEPPATEVEVPAPVQDDPVAELPQDFEIPDWFLALLDDWGWDVVA